jgi:hypothetical protein
MSCLVCHEERETTGVACAECLEELHPTIAITPEQVSVHGRQPTAAALVDPWGRLLRLHRRTMVGREIDSDGLTILDATISRRHACVEQRGETWTLRDLGSSNGTYVEDCNFGTVMPIRDGERIRFGSVAFFFLDSVGELPQVEAVALDGYTARGPVVLKTKELPRITVKDITVELRQPTGGGAGVAVFDGKPVQMTLPQFELVSILYQRAQIASEHADVRGFVHPTELVRLLSLESTTPSEDHVRQLVRRLRRVLFKAGISNVIESRYGAGYRLRLRTM